MSVSRPALPLRSHHPTRPHCTHRRTSAHNTRIQLCLAGGGGDISTLPHEVTFAWSDSSTMCWGHRPTETPLLAVVAVPHHAEHHECSLTLYCAASLPPTVGGITSHYKHKAPPTGCMGMDALFGEDRHVHPQGEGAPKGRRGGGEAPQMSL